MSQGPFNVPPQDPLPTLLRHGFRGDWVDHTHSPGDQQAPLLSGFKVDSAKGSPTGDWREEEQYFLGINSLDCLLQGDLVTALLKAGLIILGERLSPS